MDREVTAQQAGKRLLIKIDCESEEDARRMGHYLVAEARHKRWDATDAATAHKFKARFIMGACEVPGCHQLEDASIHI
jgi:hypothetical protein